MKARGWEVRAIYLDEVDRAALDAWASEQWGSGARAYALGYDGHPIVGRKVEALVIRKGQASKVYSTHGCEVTVPKRLSRRVAA